MAGELVAVVQGMFDAFDRKDLDAMMRDIDKDAQGIDEISRRWMRGSDELDAYLRGLVPMVEGHRSELRDSRETTLGDVGILTCWLAHDYTLDGQQRHVSAPTSVVLHRAEDGWKMILFHSIPLPEVEAG